MFTRAVAMPHLAMPGATIQTRTPGLRLPICLLAARLPPPEPSTADGYLPEVTSTSPSAPVRSHGTRLQTPGATCQTCYKPAITSQAESPANPFTPSPATLAPAILPTIISSTPRSAARLHQHLRLVRRRLRLRRRRHLQVRPRQQR